MTKRTIYLSNDEQWSPNEWHYEVWDAMNERPGGYNLAEVNNDASGGFRLCGSWGKDFRTIKSAKEYCKAQFGEDAMRG